MDSYRNRNLSPEQIHWERVRGYRDMIESGILSVSGACDIIGALESSLSYINNELEAEPIPKHKAGQFIRDMLVSMTKAVEDSE